MVEPITPPPPSKSSGEGGGTKYIMDKMTYNIMRQCPDRTRKIFSGYKRRMTKRDVYQGKFIENKKYLVFAEERPLKVGICWNLFCCFKAR